MSRLNLGGVTLIQHNNKVEHFGRVSQASINELLTQFGNVWGHAPVPAPRQLLPAADGDAVAQDESDNNDESDEEEDNEVDSDADDSE
jgi:ribosomal protein L12E/L44/L45/RPP1/RPP2